MKKTFLFPSLLALSLTIGFTACKKDSSKDPETNDTEIVTHTDDEARFSNETDAVANDVNVAVESNVSLTGRFMGVQGVICDADVVANTSSNPMTLTITYNGTNCLGTRTRTGVVVVSIPQGTHWKDVGAAVTVTFQQLKVTRVSDHKSITINGSQTYTNVTGGLLVNLASLGSVTRTVISPGLSITFDNGSQRTWQVAKQYVFSYDNGIVLTTTGTHTEGSITNVVAWGTNRFGRAFTSAVTSPLVIKQSCDFRLTGGAITHTTPAVTASVTFGLDAAGNTLTTCPGTGSFYYKLVWTGPNGNSLSVINPY